MQKFLKQEGEYSMKYYAVIDINVLVSAMLKWDSIPGNVMELVFGGTITPLLSGLAKPYVVTPRQMMDIIIRNMEE